MVESVSGGHTVLNKTHELLWLAGGLMLQRYPGDPWAWFIDGLSIEFERTLYCQVSSLDRIVNGAGPKRGPSTHAEELLFFVSAFLL